MNLQRRLSFIGLILLCFLPFFRVSSNTELCSPVGYTIFSINGVLTEEGKAASNAKSLRDQSPDKFLGEPLTVDYLLNPSHAEGVLDITDVAIQKFFGPTATYDLTEILNDASDKLTTQKVLLVAHSEGNFYANNFYDKVVDKEGGISNQSLGVYGVAAPTDHIAGGGRYVTSDTDNVINAVRNLFSSTLPSNISIPLDAHDTAFERGHGFSRVYLPGAGDKILADIQYSLGVLKYDQNQKENTRCLEPQKVTIGHIITSGLIHTTDNLASGVVTTAKLAYQGVIFSAKLTYSFVNLAWNTVIETGRDLASLFYEALSSQNAPIEISTDNSASVILALGTEDDLLNDVDTLTSSDISISKPVVQPDPVSIPVKKILFTGVDQGSRSVETMKLVFIGFPGSGTGFVGSGGPPLPPPPPRQVLSYEGGSVTVNTATTTTTTEETIATTTATTTATSTATTTATTTEETATTTITALETPVITVSQCDQSLASDGCLLATISLQFSWSAVPDALYYELDQNGITATTTETTLEVTAKDFTDYTLGVKAVGVELSSATSTKTVSVASIPIAINEIAWMGTQDSTSDEWIELRNNTTHVLDLTGWALTASDGTPAIHFDKTIQPKEYIVLERTSDTTISDIAAHTIYTGALGNSGEHLSLTHPSTTYDATPVGLWAGGENTSSSTRKTMERYSSKEPGADLTNWATNLKSFQNGLDAEGNSIQGTPGAKNSISYLINKGLDITEDYIVEGYGESYIIPEKLTVASSSTLTVEPGATILFTADGWMGSELLVNGSLVAHGTADDPITFASAATTTPSGFIRIKGATAAGDFDHTIFDTLFEGFEVAGGATGSVKNSQFINGDQGINAYGASTLTVENVAFDNLEDDAVGVYQESSLTMASSTITGGDASDGDGIGVYDSHASIASTTISNLNGDGIGLYDSTFSMASTTISNTRDGDALGIYGGSGTVSHVTAQDGESAGVLIYDAIVDVNDLTISGFTTDTGLTIMNDSQVTLLNVDVSNNDVGLDVDQGTTELPLPESVTIHGNTSADINIYED